MYAASGQSSGEPFDVTVEGWGADYADPYNFLNVLLDGGRAPLDLSLRLPDPLVAFDAVVRVIGRGLAHAAEVMRAPLRPIKAHES